MKKISTLLFLFFIITSCNTRRQVEKSINTGNYDAAINRAISQLQNNKGARRKEVTIIMLRDAYYKANQRDITNINNLKAANNPEFYKQIYETYLVLDQRQEAIKPLLPLMVNEKEVNFTMVNYTNDILTALENTSAHLYSQAIGMMQTNNMYSAREAYNVFNYIERENPNYRNTRNLMQRAYELGVAHVLVSIKNTSNQVIPARLEKALLDFETYGLNKFWTSYHANNNTQKTFDYAMELQLQQINISPEQVREREITRQREVVDGWQYVLDARGNVLKDSLGNDVKVDKYINVVAQINEVQQFKSSQIIAQVVFKDLNNQQIMKRFPIDSGFVFENFFGTFRGDRRALNEDDQVLVGGRPLPFPPTEQMIFDNGQDLKMKLKQILTEVQF